MPGQRTIPSSPPRPISTRLYGTLAALCLLASATAVFAQQHHAAAAHATTAVKDPWALAQKGRETLEAQPEGSRTRAQYTAAMDAYRAIYHANPADAHAPEAINAVAELLTEEGRTLHEAKASQSAVAQYEFLRKQYPGSSLRMAALLTEAQIEENDLHDATAAAEHYRELLKRYSKSEHAEEARAGLDSLQRASAKPAETVVAKSAPGVTAAAKTKQVAVAPIPSPPDTEHAAAPVMKAVADTAPVTPPHRNGPLALVSGIRHWSTPDYTRVAIDLGDEVTYEAARVPHPDRIYFDLHGAQLTKELVGKSFTITDDGFLKRIRAAQSSGDVTRVVLDVSDVTEYSAFLLPNPYRLIIDIHGAPKHDAAKIVAENVAPAVSQPSGKASAVVASVPRSAPADTASLPAMAPTSAAPASEAAKNSPAPRVAITQGATEQRPVPNAVGVSKPATAVEVADVSQQPGRVDATSKPTSRPIAAVVVPSKPDATPADGSAKNGKKGKPTQADASVVGEKPIDVASLNMPAPVVTGKKGKKVAAADAAVVGDPGVPTAAPARTLDGETSLVRALGLKIHRIVIDAGHGGHDSGTLGADGIQEKDVVLDVALRVGKLLHERLGAEIIYTRADDTFIPLETRTAIANKAQADLFLSIHANSSSDATARGVETYYLNFTSQPDALDVAARENAVSAQSIHQLADLVKKITLKDKIDESREFAQDVEASLYAGLEKGNDGLKNRGVKKAPFVVLIGANMPSILAEISFVTNPKDAAQLRTGDYRQRVAESLYKGVARYASGLNSGPPANVAKRQPAADHSSGN